MGCQGRCTFRVLRDPTRRGEAERAVEAAATVELRLLSPSSIQVASRGHARNGASWAVLSGGREGLGQGVEVDYVHGEMRELAWEDRFDAVTCVFAPFGYFDDDDNRGVLRGVRRALRPGGSFYLDLNHLPWLLQNFRDREVAERDGQWMIDRNRYDPVTGRTINQRTVIRDGRQRSFQFSVRMFAFPEVRDWLVAAGFGEVDAFSGHGEDLTLDAPRMVIVAR